MGCLPFFYCHICLHIYGNNAKKRLKRKLILTAAGISDIIRTINIYCSDPQSVQTLPTRYAEKATPAGLCRRTVPTGVWQGGRYHQGGSAMRRRAAGSEYFKAEEIQ